MKLNYFKDTDSLYIDLSPSISADSREIADGLVVDFDDTGNVVGNDIQHASKRIDLSTVESSQLPLVHYSSNYL